MPSRSRRAKAPIKRGRVDLAPSRKARRRTTARRTTSSLRGVPPKNVGGTTKQSLIKSEIASLPKGLPIESRSVARDDDLTSLPSTYNADLIVLQPRDPEWLHTYWELLPGAVARGREKLGREGPSAEFTLRVYEEGTSRWFDIPLSEGAVDWFIQVSPPDRSWTVEIGLKTRSGRFLALARSNTVRTPPAGPMEGVNGKWGYVRPGLSLRGAVATKQSH